MSKITFEFVIYMIHVCANRWNQSPSAVYRKLKETGCIGGYLVPCYDVLHTQSSQFVVDDIEEYLRVRGEAV